MDNARPLGVILAGGRSLRMGEKPKALLEFNSLPLIQHVIDRMRPQVCKLLLSVEQENPRFESFGLRQVADPRQGGRGPLGGLLASLQALDDDSDWLLLAPCDAPFVPIDLGPRLMQAALNTSLPGCVVSYKGELQPTFSLRHKNLLPQLRSAVMEEGLGGFKQFLERVTLCVLEWDSDEVAPFFNINTPEDLKRAAAF